MTSVPTSLEVRALSEEMRKDSPDAKFRRAVVVSKEVHFGVGRMLQSFSEKGPEAYQVFRHLEEALLWLNSGASTEGS
jgi:hypothetical protein